MAVLTPRQIAQYAYNAGFRGAALNQAVAIALAESGGNTNAYNREAAAGGRADSGSRGLWQIYGTAHPEYNDSRVFDPQANANAAFKVFKEAGNRFTPWSTFNLGWAKITQDFSRMITGKTSTSPVSQVARGSSAPIMTQNKNGLSAQSGIGAVKNVTLRSFLGLPEPTAKDTGPKSPEDIAFIVLGSGFVFIGLISLFIVGPSSSIKAVTGKE